MYSIDEKKLKRDINSKKKTLIVAFLITVIINVTLFIIYFKITNKDINFGKASICLSAISLILLIYTLYTFICCKKSAKNTKYLTKNGILIKDQPIYFENSLLPFDLSPCMYYIDKDMKLHKLKVRHNIDLSGKSKADLLIDPNDHNKYYIDTNIKSKNAKDYDFGNEIFPNYINYYEDNSIAKNNIIIYLTIIALLIYVFIVNTIHFKVVCGVLIVFLIKDIINMIINISTNNKIIKKIKHLSKHGKLHKDLKFEKEIITKAKYKLLIPKVKYKEKELVGDKIMYNPKEKIDLLIDEKEKIYYIDFDIQTYNEKYK